MILLDDVSKKYGDKTAVARATLRFEKGQCSALLGTSGCGKSTLLRMMIGLIPPDTGRVMIDGAEMNAASAMGLRRRMGYVIQEGGLFPHLTAAENACLLAREIGKTHDWMEARLKELSELVRLSRGDFDRYPSELSGGQRQRVGVARALFLDPDVLLLDEPLGALDPIVRAQLQADLKRIFEALSKTVILVTHDISEAAFLAQDVALMRAGKVVQRGSIEALQREPADPFVTEFFSAQRRPWWVEA
jgi:osmoprotectant transport system ATP-binding protein